jgi:branched-chain amino acid transport system substrate-binding protein
MVKRTGVGLSLVTATALFLSACSGASTGTTPAPAGGSGAPAPAAQAKIVVGVVTSQTGPNAATGKQVAVGVQQAAKEWNEKGGINGQQIDVVVEDDAGTPTAALNAFNKVMSSKPVAIIDPTFAGLVMATEPAVKQAKIPVFTSATGTAITKSGDGWFFRLRTNDEKQGKLAANYAINDLKSKQPAILYPDNDYGKPGFEVIKATLEKAGVKLVDAEVYHQGDKDVSTQLRKIKSAGADLLISWTIPTDSGMVAVQAQQIGLGIPIFGSPGFGTGEYLQLAQDATNGISVLVDATIGFDDKSKEFVARVNKNFKDSPVSFVVSANYDGANMLFEALKKSGNEPAKVKAALLATQNYQGVTGPYSFDKEGNGLHQGVLGKWENQKLVPIKTMSLND